MCQWPIPGSTAYPVFTLLHVYTCAHDILNAESVGHLARKSEVLGSIPSLVAFSRGWSGGAMVLGKLPVPGRPTILITVGQGPIALAVGAVGGGLDLFTLVYPFSSFSLSFGDGSI